MAITRRGGVSDSAHSHIKALLLDGLLPINEWIPVDAIATSLEVSRQPVMDALKRLAVEGFVTIVPQVGSKPKLYAPSSIRDFYTLFAEGERQIAELSAERATSSDIASLRKISSQIGKLRRMRSDAQNIGRTYRILNRELHAEFRRIAQSAVVTEIVEGLGDRSDFFVATSNAPIFAERIRDAHDEHEEVISAVEEHDPVRAGSIMRTHILAIADRIKD